MSKSKYFVIIFFWVSQFVWAQTGNLKTFLDNAQSNSATVLSQGNLKEITNLQRNLIIAQNKGFQVEATSEILIAPYFNNNGNFIDITTSPSPDAYGYDVGITNGGLYSAQINVTKNILNQGLVDNLLLQNDLQNETNALTAADSSHTLTKNVTDTYIMAYQLQLKREFNHEILKDLEKRLKVVEVLVKRGVLMQSDYLLLQLDIEQKKLELQQLQIDFRTTLSQLNMQSGLSLIEVTELTPPDFEITTEPSTPFYQKKFENDSLQLKAEQLVFENKYKPQISLYANTGLNAVDTRNLDHTVGASAGLRVTVPIYDSKQKKINNLQSKLKYQNLGYYRTYNRQKLKTQKQNIQYQIEANQKSNELLEGILKKQESILEVYKGKMVQGQVSIIDYLKILQDYKINIYTKLQMQTNLWLLKNQYNYINW